MMEKVPSIYKALAAKEYLKQREKVLDNLTPAIQKSLYYRAYQILDEISVKESKNGNLKPIVPPGISQLVWDNFPIQFRSALNPLGQFCSSTMLDFFRKFHIALSRAEREILEKK